ncbi:DUF423 domain-containing protein [Bacillus coahuilensis]|uniref:DUF423 domain-containing protein n=1 Tax=Bacillus coahuilensis TaxID=408580 RepID=UPI0009D72681|nr:DUF423 domain-containing protein [Bacillus coahuilensis]
MLLGAINAFLSVAFGAFGAHALEGKLEAKYIETWQKAVQYQMFHAGGLFVVGLLGLHVTGNSLLNWAGWLLFAGILFFSGSLYILSLTKISVLGAITPIGGVLFLAGWVLIGIASLKWL